MNVKEMPFEQLVELYHPLVLKVIQSLHIYKDHEVFYQVGLIGLWEAQTRFIPEKGSFSTFAFSTMKGRILDSLKKDTRFYERHQTVDSEELDIADVNASTDIDDDILETYCVGLSENQRKWVRGKIIEDKKLKDIANEFGVTEQAVKSWGREALKKLRCKFGEIKGLCD